MNTEECFRIFFQLFRVSQICTSNESAIISHEDIVKTIKRLEIIEHFIIQYISIFSLHLRIIIDN